MHFVCATYNRVFKCWFCFISANTSIVISIFLNTSFSFFCICSNELRYSLGFYIISIPLVEDNSAFRQPNEILLTEAMNKVNIYFIIRNKMRIVLKPFGYNEKRAIVSTYTDYDICAYITTYTASQSDIAHVRVT